MAIHDTVNAATALINAGRAVFGDASNGKLPSGSQVADAYRNIRKLGRSIKDTTTNSLTGYTDMATVRARIYLDALVANDPIMKDLVLRIHQQYVAMIIVALHLQKLVTKGQSVRQLLNVVRSSVDLESFVDIEELLNESIVDLEDYSLEVMSDTARRSIGQSPASAPGSSPEETQKQKDAKTLARTVGAGSNVSMKDMKIADPSIPVGQMIPIEFTNPDNDKIKIQMTINVVMAPTVVPAQIAPMFITKSADPGFMKRLVQWRVGELSFWRDLVFCVDKIEAQTKAARADTNGAYRQFLAETAKKDRDQLTNLLNQAHGESSSQLASKNIANTVLVFSEETVKAAKAETGIDLHKDADRHRYFVETYAMIIAIVDPFHRQVTLYQNGISGGSDLSYDAIKISGGKDDTDITKLLALMNAGRPARF